MPEDFDRFDARFFGMSAARGRDPRSAAAALPRNRLGGAGGRRLRPGDHGRPRRRVRRRRDEHYLMRQPGLAGRGALARSAAGDDRQHAGLAGHARLVQAGPAGSELLGAERLLDVARGGPPRLPEPAGRRVRRGARRRRVSLPLSQLTGYAYQEGSIASPDGHCRAFDAGARGHGVRRRGGHRGAEAAGGRAGRRRHDPRRAAGLGGQQRRLAEGGLHGAQRRGPGGGAAEALAAAGVRAGGDRLRRGARHRHRGRRSDRDRRRSPGRSAAQRRAKLRARLGQDQLRAPRRRGGRGGPDQDRARAGAPADPAQPALRGAEPGDRLRGGPFYVNSALAAWPRKAAPRRGQLVRHRRHQRARGPRGGAGGRSLAFIPALAAAGALGPHARRRSKRRRSNLADHLRRAPGPRHRGRRLDAPDRAQGLPLPARGGLPRAGRRGRGPGEPGPGAGVDGQRRARAVGGVPVPRPGLAVPGHGTGDLRQRAGLPPGDRPLRGDPAASPRARPARGDPGARIPDLLGRTAITQPALFAFEYALAAALAGLGDRAGRPAGPQPRRVRGGLPGGRLLARRRAGTGRRARPAHGRPAGRGDARGAAAGARGAALSWATTSPSPRSTSRRAAWSRVRSRRSRRWSAGCPRTG